MEKMENFESESRPLDISSGWDKQVNGNADKAEKDRQKQAEEEKRKKLDEEAERKKWAEAEESLRKIMQEEQQEANHRATQRIRRLMSLFALAVALIIAGGVCLNYVDDFPLPVAAGVAVAGNSLFMFLVGWLFGHKAQQ